MEKISEGGLVELFRGEYLVVPQQQQQQQQVPVIRESVEENTVSSFLVVITDVVPSSPDLDLLGNILKAAKIDVKKVYVIQNKSFDETVEKYHPKHLISFGKSGFDLGIKSVQIDLYSPKEYKGVPVLVVDAISKISVSQDKKKALWLNLKRIFNL